MYVELPGTEVGRIVVLSMVGDNELNEISICSVESGTIPTSDFGKYYIQEIEE